MYAKANPGLVETHVSPRSSDSYCRPSTTVRRVRAGCATTVRRIRGVCSSEVGGEPHGGREQHPEQSDARATTATGWRMESLLANGTCRPDLRGPSPPPYAGGMRLPARALLLIAALGLLALARS